MKRNLNISNNNVVACLIIGVPVYMAIVLSLMPLISSYGSFLLWFGLTSIVGAFLVAGGIVNDRRKSMLKIGVFIVVVSNLLIASTIYFFLGK